VPLPTVSICILVYNRREELRETLQRMLEQSDYPRELLEPIVVDNASSDGSGDMVREEFPDVKLIARDENIGASAWNDSFRIATGDYVLVLDDDCYMPPDGLTRAVAAAQEHEADLVSFAVESSVMPGYYFSRAYKTGLFSFWGCAWLIKRSVVQELGGYDPEIFIWANELEFTMRFFDHGYKHLHDPTIVAQHMKHPGDDTLDIEERGYKINANHWGYIAGKLFQPRDAAEALLALALRCVREAVRLDAVAIKGVPETFKGFRHGLRHRRPVRPEVSRFYRHNFETFASPWWMARPVRELVLELPRELVRERTTRNPPKHRGRRDEYYEKRAHLYPLERPEALQLRQS
jgi:GT2 family glycosyltransferase